MAITTSILTGGINNHQTTSEEANAVYTDFVSQGVQGTITNTTGVAPATGSFAVNAQGTPDNTVAVSAGVAYVTGTPTSQNSQKFRVKNSASTNLTISANSSGSTKYDWIYIKLDATKLNAPNSAGDDVATIVASRSSSASSDDGTPPTYGIAIAVVTVANGFSTITNSNIRDVRTQSTVTATAGQTSQDWYSLGYTPSTVTNNGNRSYDITFGSTVASYLTPGMRLRTTRTVAAPTQCTDLEASSLQYYSKTSPAGMTFTDDFTCMAWIKLESYDATLSPVIYRYNGTNGWGLRINSSGQVDLFGATTSYDSITSYQSVPLNKWVHVAAQLDMSTASTSTSKVFIDGIEVPAFYTNGGATAVTQAGDLTIGKSSGSNYFDGKIAQAAVFSAVLSASTIRSYISQTLSGSETSLVSAYSFNNSINDLNTTNANNLTANGGALATNSDSPFSVDSNGTPGGSYDYAIVTKVATTTITVQVPEGCTIPTSGGISAVSYSGLKVPYGFPVDSGRWRVSTILRFSAVQAPPVNNTWYNLTATSGTTGGQVLNIPVGNWNYGYFANIQCADTASDADIQATLSTANNTESDTEMTCWLYTAAIGGVLAMQNREKNLSISSAASYYLNSRTTLSSTSIGMRHDTATGVIYADPALL